MFNDSEFRKSLLVSLITSVLVLIFIEPLLKLAADGIMWLGTNISASFTKSVYTSAALGFREKYSFITLMFILSTLAGVIAGTTSVRILPPRSENSKSQSRAKRRKVFSILIAFSFLVSSLDTMASNFIELQLNASFNQRVTVLSAKIPEQRIKELKAAWASMENRSDYEALTAQMNSLAKEQGVKLPVALWE